MPARDPGASLVAIPMAKRLNGSGVVWLGCQRATADYFGLWQLPTPADWGTPSGDGYRRVSGRHLSRNRFKGTPYRIAYSGQSESGRQSLARFRLSTGHTKQTLQVLTNHLNAVGADWLYLTTETGARLSDLAFMAQPLAA